MRELHPQTDARVCGFFYAGVLNRQTNPEPGLKSRDSFSDDSRDDERIQSRAMTNTPRLRRFSAVEDWHTRDTRPERHRPGYIHIRPAQRSSP